MSVVPDLLLKPAAAEVKAKAPNQNQSNPAVAAQARKQEPSSFSRVYERERQATSSEAPPPRAHAEAGRKASPAKAESANEPSPAETPMVAEGGNMLPPDPAQPTPDPLLLLGLGLGEAEQEPAAEEEGDEPAVIMDAPLASLFSAPVAVDAARIDPEMEKLNSAAAVKVAVELDSAGKRMAQGTKGVDTDALASAREVDPEAQEPGLESLLSATLDPSASGEEMEVLVRSAAADVSSEAVGEPRAEAFAGRLSALAQQINPQLQVSRAMPMVPGQPVPMQQGGWSEAVVDRVMWLSSQNLKSAEIQLDPAELGRLEVRISMNQEVAQVTFASANPNVRDALEAQMHRLRELFAQQGMNQLDVNVSDQSLARGWQGSGDERQARQGEAGGDSSEDPLVSGVDTGVSHVRADRGLVDYYA